MNRAALLTREDALTDALRAVDSAIGDEQPTDQAMRIIDAIKRLRPSEPARLTSPNRVDYLDRVQKAARGAWSAAHGPMNFGPEHDAVAGVDTPIGRLRAVVWRRRWHGNRRGDRIAWAGEYYLDDDPVTIAEIVTAGLARRPTTRCRQRMEPTK